MAQPGFGQTFQSSDWLAAAGVKYTCEYPYDDEPTRLKTKHGPLVTLPYPIECQDVTTLAVQTQEASYFARKCIDAFDQLYKESEKRPKVSRSRSIRTPPARPTRSSISSKSTTTC
jgi:hypothetical protein